MSDGMVVEIYEHAGHCVFMFFPRPNDSLPCASVSIQNPCDWDDILMIYFGVIVDSEHDPRKSDDTGLMPITFIGDSKVQWKMGVHRA